jgi:hypothetical protein
MIPLSPQALVDCSWGFGNNGCDGGEAERCVCRGSCGTRFFRLLILWISLFLLTLQRSAFGWILQQGGLPTEASYGVYEMADGLCHNKDKSVEIGARISGAVLIFSVLVPHRFSLLPRSVWFLSAFKKIALRFVCSSMCFLTRCFQVTPM